MAVFSQSDDAENGLYRSSQAMVYLSETVSRNGSAVLNIRALLACLNVDNAENGLTRRFWFRLSQLGPRQGRGVCRGLLGGFSRTTQLILCRKGTKFLAFV